MPSSAFTDLDRALQATAAAPEDDGLRLALHAELTRTEVFVLLEQEITGDQMVPRVFDLSQGPAVLVFDSEERLAGFAGQSAYAALPGRVLVNMLAGQGLSLIVNADTDHAGFLPPEALSWLAQTLAAPEPETAQALPDTIAHPVLPDAVLARLVPALERRLSGIPGLDGAVLVQVRWQGAGQGHALALSGLPEVAHPPVARAVAEALTLSGLEQGALDVLFPAPAAMARFSAVGLALNPAPFEMPDDHVLTPGANPGLDPTRPPRLK